MNAKRWLLGCLVLGGCGLQKDTEPTGSKVFGKTTRDVKEFDPNKPNQKISDGSFEYTDPISGPLKAYDAAFERTFPALIKHDIDMFHAIENRYPKDYKEFMERIIKENNRQFPVLSAGKRWEYDAKKHELVVVQDVEPPKEKKK